ncbi:hypothetical protein MUN82_01975 [Hymenobacter aerilatus]|uniref:Uncharacterized protein n=1 Tax=Hymenobacter aerilatus TaxID=2932251 RepID=A0A8T9T1K1_9BACT|nr:hypothetical protein [Hymenobacter aerilatus]UOR05879.1 hypothetical protein MUN82_01975 [Hymenobacter aerilatus]
MATQTLNLEPVYNKLKSYFNTKKAVKVTPWTDKVTVTHYETVIFEIDAWGQITLNNGGYLTKTTKSHLNECLEIAGKVEKVYQKGGIWYVKGLDNVEFTKNFKMTTY